MRCCGQMRTVSTGSARYRVPRICCCGPRRSMSAHSSASVSTRSDVRPSSRRQRWRSEARSITSALAWDWARRSKSSSCRRLSTSTTRRSYACPQICLCPRTKRSMPPWSGSSLRLRDGWAGGHSLCSPHTASFETCMRRCGSESTWMRCSSSARASTASAASFSRRSRKPSARSFSVRRASGRALTFRASA